MADRLRRFGPALQRASNVLRRWSDNTFCGTRNVGWRLDATASVFNRVFSAIPRPAQGGYRKRKSPPVSGLFPYAPKRTRTSTRLSRTRPSTRFEPARYVPFRSMRSILSTRGNTLDALDDLDVVTGVVAIRDQGLVAPCSSSSTRSSTSPWLSSRGAGGRWHRGLSDAARNRMRVPVQLVRGATAGAISRAAWRFACGPRRARRWGGR